MADFYRDMQAVASGLLSQFKQGVIQYVAVTPGAGSPDEPGAATPTTTTINATARGVSFKYIDNANVVASDLQLTMPGDGIEPNVNGFVLVDGVRFKIVRVIRKPAAGTPVAYTVIFRK